MKAVIFFRDSDARLVAKRFCADVKAYLGEDALPVSLIRSGNKLLCGVEDRNDNPSLQTFPLQAEPGQRSFDAFLRSRKRAEDPGCHAIACWVWAEGRSLKDFVEDIANLCGQSQFIDSPRRRLVLYIVAPSSKVPKEWKDCLEIVKEIYRSPALRSVVLVTDRTCSGTLMWPDEPLDQLRLWLWGSLISYETSAHGDASRDALDDLKYNFWPTNDTDGDWRGTHFSSIGAVAKSQYNRERLQRLWQSQVFRELENSINLESGQVGNQLPSETVEDIVKSATAGMEDKVSSETFSSPEFTSGLPWTREKMRASLKAWQLRARLELEQAGKLRREALTKKKDGISEILRQEVRSRVEKYLKSLETHEKQLLNAPLGESLWVRLPAYLKDIGSQRENLDNLLKPAWGEWKHLDDGSIRNAAAIIEPAVEAAQQKLEELTVGRLVKWLSLCMIIPAVAGGVFMALNSFFPFTIPLKSWMIGIGLVGAGSLSAGIAFWLWNRKRIVILNELKDDVQEAFNALHVRYQKVLGQLLLFYNNKLFQVAKGILDDRLLQWGGFQERIGAIQDAPAQDKADRLLTPTQKKDIIKSLENCWKSFVTRLSPEKPLIPLWESEVEKPLREEIIKVLDGLTVDPETIWEKMEAIDWPLPLANYANPGGTKYIMLVPKGFDALPPERMDTKNAFIAKGSPPHTLVKMAYRSGSHEEIILSGSDEEIILKD